MVQWQEDYDRILGVGPVPEQGPCRGRAVTKRTALVYRNAIVDTTTNKYYAYESLEAVPARYQVLMQILTDREQGALRSR